MIPEQAREEAKRLLLEVMRGGDPSTERHNLRAGKTVKELCEAYLQASKDRLRETTQKRYRHVIDHLSTSFLSRKADLTRRQHARDAIQEFPGESPSTKNLVHRFLSAAFRWGISEEVVEGNPMAGLKITRERKRGRVLTSEELGRLLEALDSVEAENPLRKVPCNIIRFLLFSGCRKNEVAKMRWSWVDRPSGVIHIPEFGSKTGERTVPLNPSLAAILEDQERLEMAGDFVFRSQSRAGKLASVDRIWHYVVRPLAKLEGLRIHDLRHTALSTAAALGLNAFSVQSLGGHKSLSTTMRYIHAAEGNSGAHLASAAVAEELERQAEAGKKIQEIG
jgi:integrase